MKTNFIRALLLLCLLPTSCRDFLDEKSDSALTILQLLEDNQALLDRGFMLGSTPNSGEISADDIYVTDADFSALSVNAEKRLYTWQPDFVADVVDNDWGSCYRRINVFNTVLYNLDYYNITDAENVKGQALAFRAAAYLDAVQIWCPAYNVANADAQLGLPLRLNPDMNLPSVRSSLKDTYTLIIKDLKEAADLLPPTQITVGRPSKVTALGYLARAYLYMGDYNNALEAGLKALAIDNTLMDYNTLNPSATYPIPIRNIEVLLPTSMANSTILLSVRTRIPVSLYNTYAENDLRKTVCFRKNENGEILFKGNYSGGSSRASGMVRDEIYLTVAEAYAQLNNATEAMAVLNKLLITRWKKGTFIPLAATDSQQALTVIRTERRKELPLRGLRWADLKRYNRDGAGITLTRTVNGQVFTLPPNDPRYAIAIPEDIIKMTGMPQNPR